MTPEGDLEFFRRPPPPGRSRESAIVLDEEGRFFADGEPIVHRRLEAALHAWIARHPENGRYILSNGYDWTYFTVRATPFFVRRVRMTSDAAFLVLSDGSEEVWDPRVTRVGAREALVAAVKATTTGGPFQARFSRHAQASLEDVLEEGPDGRVGARIHGLFIPFADPEASKEVDAPPP